MLEARELRIGSLVTDQWYDSFPRIITVESIIDKGINLSIEDDGNWSELAQHFIVPEYKLDELRAIPLTEEWLLKLGFDNKSNYAVGVSSYNTMCFRKLQLLKNIDGFYYFPALPFSKVITYVHQLQNLYFALTGKELTL